LQKKKYQNSDDNVLMSRICSGDTGAFDVLYNRYSHRLLHYFFKMLGGDEDRAQDFLQTLFLKIVENPKQYKKGYNFQSWIFTIAHNMCKNEYRRMETQKRFSNEIEKSHLEHQADDKQIDDKIDYSKFKDALYNELSKIEPDHRSIFILRFQEQLSVPEIKEIIGCSEGTVKSRLFYTTKKLAKCLSEYHPYQ
jgi:RNA polymerase sigma-70 factor (ECF subfamily)